MSSLPVAVNRNLDRTNSQLPIAGDNGDTPLGGVKVDGTTIGINGEGVISVIGGGGSSAKIVASYPPTLLTFLPASPDVVLITFTPISAGYFRASLFMHVTVPDVSGTLQGQELFTSDGLAETVSFANAFNLTLFSMTDNATTTVYMRTFYADAGQPITIQIHVVIATVNFATIRACATLEQLI